ncbi:MAG TPA: hypothetical protein VK543_00075, partial [Puia sp.]|nr:hypothetical protein [Puia sp.]
EITGRPFIALECDGAKYHSSNEAYSWDMFRQAQLENFGFIFYRIWSTNWWHSTESELKKLVEFIQAKDLRERNSGAAPMLWAELEEEEEVIAVTTQNETKLKVTNKSVVTLKDAEGKIFKARFSRDERNLKKQDEQGTKIVYERAPLAISLLGRTEGEICQLGMLEVYYEIMRIE